MFTVKELNLHFPYEQSVIWGGGGMVEENLRK